jgi:hypothetical protein
MEQVLRFVLGGLIVSAFALVGDLLRPKSFAGLFGAAPSVALATLGLALVAHDGGYVATEGLSMVLGACALCLYSVLVAVLLLRHANVVVVAGGSLAVWLAAALGLWGVFLR